MATEANTSGLLETPRDILGPVVRERVFLEGREFRIAHPGETDKLLDHPFIQSAFARDEYLPYWTDLWPAARMLAKAILRASWTPGAPALEIGCGLGLPGVAALASGLQVTFSDCDGTALKFASENALANGYQDFQLLQMDWRNPPAGLQVPILFGSDLTYELRNVDPLVACIKKLLVPGGVCWLTDQDRIPARWFREVLRLEGLAFQTQLVRAGEPGGKRFKGTLYRITQATIRRC
jgi:predicted nicotinamide N-methyase